MKKISQIFKISLFIMTFFSFDSFAKIELNVVAREAASIFEILDNVSNWYPGFCDTEYQDYWKQKFGISSNDKKLFKRYQKIRKKYYNDPDQKPRDPTKNRNGFFSTLGSLSPDPYAEAFYSSDELKTAFFKLSKLVNKEELSFIKSFYKNFEEKYSPLVSKTRNGYKDVIKNTKASLVNEKVKKYTLKLQKFYNVRKNMKYEVIFVWWPPIKSTRANPTGKYLVMKSNPVKHGKGDELSLIHI